MIRIRADESLFIVSRNTLEQYPNSAFCKVLNKMEKNDYIHMDTNGDGNITLYVDTDPEIMKMIVKMLRGGIILPDYPEINFLNRTLEKFNLTLEPTNSDSIYNNDTDIQTNLEKIFDAMNLQKSDDDSMIFSTNFSDSVVPVSTNEINLSSVNEDNNENVFITNNLESILGKNDEEQKNNSFTFSNFSISSSSSKPKRKMRSKSINFDS